MNKATGVFLAIALGLGVNAHRIYGADLRQAPSQDVRSGTFNYPGTGSQNQSPNISDAAAKDLEELRRVQNQKQQTYQGLNQVNPLSADFGNAPSDGQPVLPEAFRKLMENRIFRGLMQLSLDRNFQKNLLAVADHPSRSTLLIFEVMWIIFMLFFRIWRLGKCDLWYEKLWCGTWTMMLMIFGTSIVLPYIVIGDPYMKVVSAILEVIV